MDTAHGPGPLVAATENLSRRSVIVGIGFGAIASALAAAGWTVTTLAQDATPISTPQPAVEFNAFVVLYGHPTDPTAFEDHYVNVHTPLAYEIEQLQELLLVSSMVTPEGAQGEHYRMTIALAASQSELMAGLSSEAGQAAVADLANFATGGFTAYLAHVDSLTPPWGDGTPAATPGA